MVCCHTPLDFILIQAVEINYKNIEEYQEDENFVSFRNADSGKLVFVHLGCHQ